MSVQAPVRPRPATDDELLAAAADRLSVELAPARPGARRAGRHLRPVAPLRRRRSPAVPVLVAVGIVIVALFALAVMHALLIGGQINLDGMRRDVASESEEIRRLELRVAELEAPDRVLDAARDRLGMVEPEEVGYLLPTAVDIGDAAPVRVAPAVVPPEPEPVVDVASDPDAGDESDAETSDAGTASGDADAADADEIDDVTADVTADGTATDVTGSDVTSSDATSSDGTVADEPAAGGSAE